MLEPHNLIILPLILEINQVKYIENNYINRSEHAINPDAEFYKKIKSTVQLSIWIISDLWC